MQKMCGTWLFAAWWKNKVALYRVWIQFYPEKSRKIWHKNTFYTIKPEKTTFSLVLKLLPDIQNVVSRICHAMKVH